MIAVKPGGAGSELGELISTIYNGFLALYGDADLASVATAAVINDLLSAGATGEGEAPCA